MRNSLKALFASLVLIPSALASAAPCEAPRSVPVYAASYQPQSPVLTHTWMNLTSNMTLSGKSVIAVGQQKGAFTTLELDAAGFGSGYTKVKTVTVYFANGTSQVMNVNQRVDRANNNLRLDVSGQARFITRVAIDGTSYGRGQLMIRGLAVAEAPAPAPQPLLVGNDIEFAKDGRAFLTIGADKGKFDQLTIKTEHGRALIKQVYVQFADGSEKVLRNIDKQIEAGQGITLALDSHPDAIKRLVIYGDSTSLGIRYQPAQFDVSLL